MPDREKVLNGLRCLSGEKEMVENPCAGCGYSDCQTFAICVSEVARDALELLQEPEIVRCKDCKYYRYYGPDSYISSECTLEFTDGPIPTWFCAGGERRVTQE